MGLIATYDSRWSELARRLQGPVALFLVLLVSLGAGATVILLGELAVGAFGLAAIAALTVWRARYGLYVCLFFVVFFEPMKDEPFMYYGWLIQSNISTITPLGFVNFSAIELIVAMVALVVLAGALVERRPLRIGPLGPLVLLFIGLLTASLFWGIFSGGNLTIALWEVRYLYLGCLIALLVPNVFHTRGQIEHAINLICVAAVLLAVDFIWRKYALLDTGKLVVPEDLAFGREGVIFFNFVIILLLARLVWPASPGQRLWALLIPLLIFAAMLTERRSGWVTLDIGLVLVAIFVFRMKRKVFYYVVLPLCALYVGYLGVFWNAEGAIAQPARAVRSINNPEGRDINSNLYRLIERQNIRLNIRAHPLTGLGFGEQYTFYYPMPDLSFWIFWHYIPHNGVLWVWMKMGTAGFLALLTMIGIGLVRGVQVLKRSSESRSAPYLVAIVSLMMMLFVYSYVDIGLNNVRVTALLGLALGVISVWSGSDESGEAPW